MDKYSSQQRGYFFAVLAAFQWSLMGIFGKVLFQYQIAPLTVVALRSTLVLVTLIIILALFRRQWLIIRRSDLPFFVAYGLIGVAAGFFLYFTAIDLAGVAIAAILLYTYPVFVTILSVIFLGEHITKSKVMALILTLAGVVLVSEIGVSVAGQVNPLGVVASLFAAVATATHSIFGKKAVQQYSSWTILLYSMGFGAFFLMAAQLILHGFPNLARPPVFWGALLALAWISTLGANLAYISALKHVEASRASIMATVEPVIVVVLAYAFFHEMLSPIQIFGTVLVLVGVFVVQR